MVCLQPAHHRNQRGTANTYNNKENIQIYWYKCKQILYENMYKYMRYSIMRGYIVCNHPTTDTNGGHLQHQQGKYRNNIFQIRNEQNLSNIWQQYQHVNEKPSQRGCLALISFAGQVGQKGLDPYWIRTQIPILKPCILTPYLHSYHLLIVLHFTPGSKPFPCWMIAWQLWQWLTPRETMRLLSNPLWPREGVLAMMNKVKAKGKPRWENEWLLRGRHVE